MSGCIPIPKKRPSETGLSSSELAQFVGALPTRERAFSLVKEFVAEIKRADNPVAAFIVAEWGEGKTSLYYVYLDKLRPPEAVSFIVTTKTILNYVVDALQGKIFGDTRSTAYIVFASVLAALREEQSSIIEIKCGKKPNLPKPSEFSDAVTYVQLFLRELLNEVCSEGKVILFIDEFEDLVSYSRQDAIELMVSGITHILNGIVKEISKRGDDAGPYAGRMHFVFSITPSAYAKLKSFGDLATVIARLSRRAKEIELKPLPREEAYIFIKGLVSYLYNEPIDLATVFDPPSLANPLIIASLGNLAALQRAVTELLYLNSVRFRCENDNMKIMSHENVAENLKDIRIHIAGADLPLLVESNYRRIASLWMRYLELESKVEKDTGLKFLNYALMNLIVDPKRAANDIGIEQKLFENLVFSANVFARSPQLGLGVKRFFYRIWVSEYSAELRTAFQDSLSKVLQTIPSLETEARELAESAVESLVYIDCSDRLVLAIPRNNDVSELKDFVQDLLPSVISDVEAEKLAASIARAIEELVDTYGLRNRLADRLLVSPKVSSLVFLSPELTFLNFVKDVDRRFRYWRELLAEAPEEFLVLGFVAMLSVREDKVRILSAEVV